MHTPVTRRQLWGMLTLTLLWGMNWPMMKLALEGHDAAVLSRQHHGRGGLLAAGLCGPARRAHGAAQGREWLSIVLLGLPNVLGWHTLSIFGVQALASGRAAILGFTMPIFTVLIGALFFGERITPRVRLAAASAALAIGLLLWHELQRLSGRPTGVAWMLSAAFLLGSGHCPVSPRPHDAVGHRHHGLDAAALQLAVLWALALTSGAAAATRPTFPPGSGWGWLTLPSSTTAWPS
jgi:drug/metabolite transporter (DMT)-like permease